ncbi:Uncharacterized protein TCM_008447 [Theobroma cacao]|uniref:Uncharacterized protein n=1 Tax=Theobroma cacao TaxID=3641 RepID=A0A061E5U9_THECC|nr:Uncharacterized protein TCM_008447 [Theobroma cacao]
MLISSLCLVPLLSSHLHSPNSSISTVFSSHSFIRPIYTLRSPVSTLFSSPSLIFSKLLPSFTFPTSSKFLWVFSYSFLPFVLCFLSLKFCGSG